MTVVNWNVEWATPGSWSRRDEILSRIDQEVPDIVCLTEADIRLLGGMPGHTIHSRQDGVKGIGNLRKVLLWAREPWEQVDDSGVDSMPPGRFVAGVTHTPLGDVMVVGVCIPYRDARTKWTNDGVRRGLWEDHLNYLASLPTVFERASWKRFIAQRRNYLTNDYSFSPTGGSLSVYQCLHVSAQRRYVISHGAYARKHFQYAVDSIIRPA